MKGGLRNIAIRPAAGSVRPGQRERPSRRFAEIDDVNLALE